jgi:hypothetical protein
VYVGDIHTHIHTQTDDREQREERDMKEKWTKGEKIPKNGGNEEKGTKLRKKRENK